MPAFLRLVPRLLSLVCACVCAGVVHAQSWPAKPVRWLVPFPAGQGASDIAARVLTEKLTAMWGQPIVVENKPGAGGTIATAEMLKAPADGYTIMSGTMGTHTIAPNLYKSLPFDAARDLIPVSLVVDVPLVLVASLQVPANSLRDFVSLTRDLPGKHAYASPGNGTLNHVMGELFKQVARLDMPHIPYRGGAGAYVDMYSGNVAIMFDPILSATTQVKQGKLKAYAIAAPKRSPALPDVPTMAELGYAGFEATLWLGVFAPTGTPAAVVNRISVDIGTVLKNPEVRARLEGLGGEVVGMPHDAFSKAYARDLGRWGKAIKELNIKID
ncbi:MAG: Bug family tripartite tricarboxylate transporter substrate binding protein [Burkholderiales bacterium]